MPAEKHAYDGRVTIDGGKVERCCGGAVDEVGWGWTGLDESGTRSCRSDDERAEDGLRGESAGYEYQQDRRGPIGRERTCSPAWLTIGQTVFGGAD